jgi:hypothetical protein
MTIVIGALEFLGPLNDIDSLSDVPGIYAVLCESKGELELIEMGDAECVRECIAAHPDRNFWNDEAMDISFAVHYTSDLSHDERREIKECLDREFDDPVAA